MNILSYITIFSLFLYILQTLNVWLIEINEMFSYQLTIAKNMCAFIDIESSYVGVNFSITGPQWEMQTDLWMMPDLKT